jgi:hypothetical protein
MPIKAMATGEVRERFVVPEGNHPARVVIVADLGDQETEWAGEKKVQPKVWIGFEVADPEIYLEIDGEKKPAHLGREFTLSWNEKASMTKVLGGWAKAVTKKKNLEDIDLCSLISAPCLIQVTHREAKNGNTYANVTGISSVPKGVMVPPLVGDPVVYDGNVEDYDKLPPFLRTKIDNQIEEEPPF